MRLLTLRFFLLVTVSATASVLAGCGSTSSSNNPPPNNPPPPTTVTVTPSTATLYLGQTQQFTAHVSDPSNKTVTWSVPAGYGTINSTGLYTASSDFGGGSFDVTATSNSSPASSGTATVTLPAVTFAIAPNSITVKPSASTTFSATLVGLSSSEVAWSVQGTGGGSITNAGVYTAPSVEGVYSVVATSVADPKYQATAAVLVSTSAHAFFPTGDTQTPRAFHTATLLPNGKVLVAGGSVYRAYCLAGIDAAEIYDSASGTFASTGTMANPRYAQTATPLLNGDVLITGGFSYDAAACGDMDPTPAVKTAELYDHAKSTFQLTGSMAEERGGHTATRLADGKVLITGGGNSGDGDLPNLGDGSITAEIYDPALGVFTPTGNMATGRVGHAATLLADGKVLITGGWTSSSATATAELYDPLTGAFNPTGSMTSPRAAHTATLLHDGRVLITGGLFDVSLPGSETAEIYDPVTGLFAATGSMEVARLLHTATLLPDETVLVVGGGSQAAEIYNPATALFAGVGLTESGRSGHTATLLQNGSVIVIGGFVDYAFEPLNTAELYQ